MKRFILALAAAATLIVGTLATPSTAEAQRGRGYYYGPAYSGGYYRPYYGGYYRPNYYGYGGYYRPYYRPYNYSYGYYPYRSYYGSPGYYASPGVRIGSAPVGVRIY